MKAQAPLKSAIVLALNAAAGNPRNSEGAFVTLTDGRILFAWSRYRGESWADEARADIAARFSSDGGKTWSPEERILVSNEVACNVMSASLLRLQDGRIALFCLRKNSLCDCRLWMRTSADEGDTWSEPACCIPAPWRGASSAPWTRRACTGWWTPMESSSPVRLRAMAGA
ncbi:MAG: sialidase family protein [bacterium]